MLNNGLSLFFFAFLFVFVFFFCTVVAKKEIYYENEPIDKFPESLSCKLPNTGNLI